MTSSVYVTCQFTALHCWPDAPESHAFLRNPHRHVFHVLASAPVKHDDRDIEFIFLKERVQTYCNGWFADRDMKQTSCEMFAKQILLAFDELNYVEITEDDENGAIVWRENEQQRPV